MQHQKLHTEVKPQFSYIPSLDGLRAFSILLVLLQHFGFHHIIPGGFGVNIFFFISGFLITRLLCAELNLNQSVSLKNFYARRMFRIIPAYLFFLAGSVALYLLFKTPFHWDELYPVAFFYKNYVSAFQKMGWLPLDNALPFGTLWSICVEEHFYLVFPLMFVLFHKNIKKFILALLGVIVLCNLWRMTTLGVFHFHHLYNYFTTDTRFDSILYGCLFSLLTNIDAMQEQVKKLYSPKWVIAALAVVLLTLFLPGQFFKFTIRYTLQGFAFMPIFAFLLFAPQQNWLKSILNWPLLKWIGKLSYSLYLWQICALGVAFALLPAALEQYVNALGFILSFVFASISYYWIEMPFLRLSKKYFSASKALVSESINPRNQEDRQTGLHIKYPEYS